jgi:imidazolonepropionase-like amidohydrolase
MSVTQRVIAGWLLDGSGAPAKKGAVLEIGAGKILAVRPPDTAVPEGSTASSDLDLSACTILPTLVDVHVHLTMSGSADPGLRRHQLEMTYPQAAAVMRRHLVQHLAAGVAAVRDGGDHRGHTLSFKQREKPPMVHMAVAGKAWHAAGRYGRLTGRPPEGQGGLAGAIARCGGRCGARADHVKIVNSGLNSLQAFGRETKAQFSAAEMRAAVAAASDLDLPVMVHANGRQPVADALAAGCASIEHGFFMGRANLETMAAKGAVWVPTAVTMAAYACQLTRGENIGGAASGAELDVVHRNCDHQLEQLRMARELGVAVAVGTDAGSLGVNHGRAVAEEMGLLAQAGYPLAAVVRAATWTGARLLGLDDRGLLSAGLRADFIAVAGPPETLLTRIAAPEAVFLAGERVGTAQAQGAPTPAAH